MKKEKNWLSYPLWLLYALVTVSYAAACLMGGCVFAGGFGYYMAGGVLMLAFGGVAGIWFVGHRLAGRLGEKLSGFRLKKTAELFVVLLLCAAAVGLRLYLMARYDGTVGGSEFYDMASVKAGGGVPWIAHGASRIYAWTLAIVLSFAGNKPLAGVVLQILLQVFGMFVFYYAVRLLTGRAEAFFGSALLAFAPEISRGIFTLSPEPLYFLLYMAILLLCGFSVKKGYEKDLSEANAQITEAGPAGACSKRAAGKGNRRKYGLSVLCGISIGLAGYLDLFGWTMLLFAGSVSMRRKTEDSKRGVFLRMPYLLCILAAFLAAAAFFGMDAAAGGHSYRETLSAWLSHPLSGFSLRTGIGDIMGMDLFRVSPAKLLICFCGAFGIVGFWFRKTAEQDRWILLFLILLSFRLTGLNSMGDSTFMMAVWGVLAGIGICSMGRQQAAAHPAGMLSAESGFAGMPSAGTEREKTVGQKDGTEAQTAAAGIVGEGEQGEKEVPADGKPKVKLIENPLPLPKKHVRREMNYAKEIKSDEMEFDLSVQEEDDFDID